MSSTAVTLPEGEAHPPTNIGSTLLARHSEGALRGRWVRGENGGRLLALPSLSCGVDPDGNLVRYQPPASLRLTLLFMVMGMFGVALLAISVVARAHALDVGASPTPPSLLSLLDYGTLALATLGYVLAVLFFVLGCISQLHFLFRRKRRYVTRPLSDPERERIAGYVQSTFSDSSDLESKQASQ